MSKVPPEEPKVEPEDFFAIMCVQAEEVNVERAQRDQKNPGRQKFVVNLVTYYSDYCRANGIRKDRGYLETFKRVLSSRTTELIDVIRACQENNFLGFVNAMRKIDFEACKQLGRVEATRAGVRKDVAELFPPPRSAFEVLEGKTTAPRQVWHPPRRGPDEERLDRAA